MTVSYTGLRQVPRIDLAAAVPLAVPLTIHIEPTNICNFLCSFCPVSLPTYAKESGFHHHMPMDLYRKIVDDMVDLGAVRSLKMYFIGEPFLNPDLLEMVRIARAHNIAERIEITTNGSILPFDTLFSGIDYLRISIYTPKPSKITRNVKALFDQRNHWGMKEPHICVKYMPNSEADRDLFLKTYEGVSDESIIEGYHNWASTTGLTNIMVNPMSKHNCPFVHYMMVIKANGDVVPCCVDWNAQLKFGNVRETSLKDLWNGPIREDLVLKHIRHERSGIPTCVNCDLPETTPDNLDRMTVLDYEERKFERSRSAR